MLAKAIRIQWMKEMGLDWDEIEESLRDDPPVSVDEEMKQLRALRNAKAITPSHEALRRIAKRFK